MERSEGIIGVTGERQRYGRNKNTVVNQTYIASGEYRRKFDQITSDKQVNRLIYKVSKEMLLHRSGTEYEDMYWIDAKTGSVIYAQKEERRKLGIVHTRGICKILKQHEHVIGIHTHPYNHPPSYNDFNCFVKYQYSLGVVICHDGSIYVYSAHRYISPVLWNSYINAASKSFYSDIDIQKKVIEKFMQIGDIYCREVNENESYG